MSDRKVMLDEDDLRALAATSVRAGTQDRFIAVALDWAKEASQRISGLNTENMRLRKAEGHRTGCALRGKLLAGIAPMCTPCTCPDIATRKHTALLGRLEAKTEKWRGQRAHTYASENADLYAAQDSVRSQCAREVESIIKEFKEA